MLKIINKKLKFFVNKLPLVKIILLEVYGLFENFVVKYPNTKFGFWMRQKYWSTKYKIGENPFLCQGTILHASKNELINIGDNVELGNNVVLNIGECKGLYIGDYVSIAMNVFIRSGNHKFDREDIPIQKQGHDCKVLNFNNREYSIIIEDDVWIGAHCVLVSGAHIAKGTVVAAGSIVTKSFPAYSVIGGNPARIIKRRFNV